MTIITRVTLGLFSIVLIMSLVYVVVGSYHLKKTLSNQLTLIIEGTFETAFEEDKFLFLSSDEESLKQWLSLFLNIKSVKGAAILNNDQIPLIATSDYWTVIDEEEVQIINKKLNFKEEHPNRYAFVNIIVKQDKKSAHKAILLTIVTILTISTCICVPFLIVLARHISKPILSLKNQINDIDPESNDFKKVLLDKSTPKELLPVGRVINSLLTSIQNHTANLNKLVIARTEKLNDANIKMKEYEKEKSRIISHLSHDLQTPLTALRLYIDLVKSGIKNKDLDSSVIDNLDKAGERSNVLMNEISRILKTASAGITDTVKTSFNLHDVCNSIIKNNEAQTTASKNNVTLKYTGEKIVITSHEIVSHVIDNLLGNANKYCQNGEIKIDVHVDKQIQFTISDDGIGLSDSEMAVLFKPNRRKRDLNNKSHGLGLYLSYDSLSSINGVMSAKRLKKGLSLNFKVPNEKGMLKR